VNFLRDIENLIRMTIPVSHRRINRRQVERPPAVGAVNNHAPTPSDGTGTEVMRRARKVATVSTTKPERTAAK
jgi:hypothetical protein